MTDEEAASLLARRATALPCAYCGVPMDPENPSTRPTQDHIWPKRLRSISEGRIGRLWCCAACNTKKADKTPSEWLAMLTGD